MVGLLGCGCCETKPPGYLPCDCDLPGRVIREDYETGWDEPVPDAPIFIRPYRVRSGGPAFTYDKWIHSSRFHVAAKTRFITSVIPNLYPIPTWHGYLFYWPEYDPYPGYELGFEPGDASRFYVQFSWNEYDYEVSYDICFSSGVKANFWGQATGTGSVDTRRFSQICCEPRFGTTPTPDTGNGIAFGTYGDWQGPPTVTLGPAGPIFNHRVLCYDSVRSNVLGGGFSPPATIIDVLNFDTTYKIKCVMKCPALVYPNHGTLTTQWFIDDRLVKQFDITTEARGEWTQCNDSYWKLRRCTIIDFAYSFVAPTAFYPSNPALAVYTDNFKFKRLDKKP